MATRTPLAQLNAGHVLTAAEANLLPRGLLGYIKRTTAQTGISSIVDLTGMTVTMTVAPSRQLRITGGCRVVQNTSVGFVELSAVVGSTVLDRKGKSLAVNEGFSPQVESVYDTGAGGSITVKLQLNTSGGGTVDTVNSSSAPLLCTLLEVEDVGPSF